jgi:predicted 2-oxoglutarate/Fe(II)-dependent dioxygenase YbiX
MVLKQPSYRRHPDDNIFVIDNVITDELCDKIVEQIKLGKKDKSDWQDLHNNVICESMLVNDIQDIQIRDELDSTIFKAINSFAKLLSLYDISCTNDTGFILRKITGPTRLHVDGVQANTHNPSKEYRVMSIVIALNEDYDGGEFVFPQQKRKFKLKKGQLIGFPSNWTHPHGTNSLKNGTVRYTITTWLTNK